MLVKSSFFEFSSYRLEKKSLNLRFNYKINFNSEKTWAFSETVTLPKIPRFDDIPDKLLDSILFNLHIILGISYFKLYLPEVIRLNKPMTYEQSIFWNTVYRKGLGEFFYRNNINPATIAKFPYDKNLNQSPSFELSTKNRCLVGIGGGKDSIVVAELLMRNRQDISAFVVETQKEAKLQRRIIKEINVPQITVKRILDHKVLNTPAGSLTGHIPVSAIYAFLSLACAIFYDYKYIVMGNEKSSDYGNTIYQGQVINHQWSKSVEFENLFQKYVRDNITDGVIFFSLLRPFYDIRVAEMFSGFKKYHSFFSSCNKNFSINQKNSPTRWCNRCPKCLSTFTLLSAFIKKSELIKIFGKNLYRDSDNLSGFKDILGFNRIKPFECVGTPDEIKAAFSLAGETYQNDIAIKTFLPRIKNAKNLIKSVFKSYPAFSIPTQFRLLGMKNALILGFGREGKTTKDYLTQNFPDLKIGIADQNSGPEYLEKQNVYDIAIKTPGIPKRKVKIQYTTATNLFFSQIPNVTVGVTGSKGKSTTSSLIYSILKEAGYKTHLLGNIGKPMLDAVLRPVEKGVIFVLELSSFQLDDIAYSPNIAVVLNLFPEHLDYHGSLRNYYQAKKNIINFQKRSDFFIYNPNYKILKNWVISARAQSIPFVEDVPVTDSEIPLIGDHNKENIKAATTVARLFNVSGEKLKSAIKKFKPLPHRLEFVGTFNGVRFYDDAISTTPQSTIAAIKSIPHISTIFLGGTDRGYNFAQLEKTIRRFGIINVVLFPPSGNRIFKISTGLNIFKTIKMKDAVEFAFKNSKPGTVCILSTASPSFSLWKNYEDKGNQFQNFVRSYLEFNNTF